MNNIVACTLTEVSTGLDCIIRIYKDSKKWKQHWDWIGGRLKVNDPYLWTHSVPVPQNSGSLLLLANKVPTNLSENGLHQYCRLDQVPLKFLDLAPGTTFRGEGTFILTESRLTWSMWFRTEDSQK